MSQLVQRPDSLRPRSARIVGGVFAVIAAAALAHCGFPEFGGFTDNADASAGGAGGSTTGGAGGVGGEGGAAGGISGGAGGTSTGGTAGSGGQGGSAGTGGSTGGTGGTGTGGSTGGTGGSTGGTGGTGATGGTGGTSGTGGTGGSTGGTGGDAGPETALSLLTVWHVPTSAEVGALTMRDPMALDATVNQVFVYVGEERQEGEVAGGQLFWWWSDALTSTQPTAVDLVWDSNVNNHDYWRAAIPLPTRRVGTFKYYVRVDPADTASFATTWLYGTDTESSKAATEAVASAAPYKPTFPAPAVGELVITEVMVNAFGSTEASKEWFEVVSRAAGPVSMNGLMVGDSSSAQPISSPDFVLWPGVYTTFGATADSSNLEGFAADYAYGTSMNFSNSAADAVRLMLPDQTVIDTVAWTSSASWPCHTDAHTMQYNTATPVADGNDVATAWCESQKAYGTGTSYGTPNAPTDGCQP